jgi:hypothetical protein
LSSIGESWHKQPGPAVTQMILRHSHDRTALGQSSGAQQRRPGYPTAVHSVSFGVGPISHSHASIEVT